MAQDSFEKQDESLMKGLKQQRERQIPEDALCGFSESVEKRILETQNQPPFFSNRVILLSVVFLAFIVLGIVWQWSKPSHIVPTTAKITIQKITTFHESDIVSDVEALKALGEWTEEDEAAMGIPVENAFADFDLDVDDDGMMLGKNLAVSIR